MTIETGIMGAGLKLESSLYTSYLDAEITGLSNSKEQACIVIPYPTGSDIGLSLAFNIPYNYSSTPKLVVRGVLKGAANTLAFGVSQLARQIGDSVDAAYEADDLYSNAVWTGYAAEDLFEAVITLTPTGYVAGDTVLLYFFRDDSVDTTTFDFLLLDLLFRYTEA